MGVKREYVKANLVKATKYVIYADDTGEHKILVDEKIPEGARIVRWTTEKEIIRYRVLMDDFIAMAEKY